MADQLEFKISEGLVRPIIDAKIKTAVVEAMGGHEIIIADMMKAYMSQRVDSEGKESGYSSSKPRLDWLVHKMLEDALKTALTQYIQSKTDFFEKEFQRFFASKKGTSQIISAMQDGFCKALTDKWRTTITFTPAER
jgi:hypothetical protein